MKEINNRRPILYVLCLSFLFLLFINNTITEQRVTTVMSDEQMAFNSVESFEETTSGDGLQFSPIERNNIKIVPGGQSIGVQMETLGVLVVGHHVVDAPDGKHSPGKDANVRVGDVILELNGTKIENMNEIKSVIEKAGKDEKGLEVTINREGKEMETVLKPIFDEKEESYKIGLYIRDSAAGIGTMTFHDLESKRYGALGHVISDVNTKKPIQTKGGTIIQSSITSIEKGNRGIPGEKHAQFFLEEGQLGGIKKNTDYGIFGELNKNISNGHYDEPLPITRPHEVKEGSAKILTVVNDEKVEVFDVEITHSNPQKKSDVKGMTIKIVDEKLLEATGGIVQGMSGSPIIQDGKLIGAVTHVFVNDPTSGYGVHIEWMLKDAGIKFPKAIKQAS